MKIRLSIALALVSLMLVALHATAEDDTAARTGRDRVFKIDAVELIDRGREMEGKVELKERHERYTYLFATQANLDAFKADPKKYRVQVGGSCARMGALSGEGSAKLFAVHDGRLYIFASEQCRRAFLGGAEKFLDRDDPAPPAAESTTQRGRELLERAVKGVGGALKLDAITSYREQLARTEESGGTTYAVTDTLTLMMPDQVRTDGCWNEQCWASIAGREDGWFIAVGEDDGLMAEDHVRAMWRTGGRHPLMLLRSRNAPGLIVTADAATRTIAFEDEGDVTLDLLTLHVDGATTTLGLDGDGRIRLLAFRGRGPTLVIGDMERRFSGFHDVAGLSLPAHVETVFNGKASAEQSGTYAIQTINDSADRVLFERIPAVPQAAATP